MLNIPIFGNIDTKNQNKTIPTKIYIGKDNIAKIVSKVYYGVANKAKLILDFVIAHYTCRRDPAYLSNSKNQLGGAVVGDYAIFGGGQSRGYNNYQYNDVDAYTEQRVKTILTSLNQTSRVGVTGASIGNYSLFAGGQLYDQFSGQSPTLYADVDVYDVNLTKSNATSLTSAFSYASSVTFGNRAIFFGDGTYYTTTLTQGKLSTTPRATGGPSNVIIDNTYAMITNGNYVDAYDSNLTITTCQSMATSRPYFGGCSVGNYALFGGGGYSASSRPYYYVTVETYNKSLTRGTASDLTGGGQHVMGASTTKYGLLAGGYIYSGGSYSYNSVNAYDSSLTKSNPTTLYQSGGMGATVNLNGFAVFAGAGDSNGSNSSSAITFILPADTNDATDRTYTSPSTTVNNDDNVYAVVN